MRTGNLLLFIFLLQAGGAAAQLTNYSLGSVPEQVKKNALCVVRQENIEFEVSDIDHARLNVHRIVTILNEGGRKKLHFAEETDKFISLDDAEIKTYDSTGKLTGKYKQKDLTTLAIAEGLIDDSKLYYLTIPASTFPVTVEYTYSLRYKGILTYPSYAFIEPGEGVENASYTVKVLKDLDLRYKEKNIHLDPVVSWDGKYKVYNWSVKDLAPIEYEEGAVSIESRNPSILLAPNRFRLDDYEGDMSSWKNFGKWYADLQKGNEGLPEERKQFFSTLVKDEPDERKKVKLVYEYLQKNFRYVSIQLGIGGYKPFSAAFTDKKKYGDCKALSNYVQAALQAIGIKSYQALINAEYNKEPVDSLFPCNQFNHVIVCVPMQKDSIWLECTSKTNDFGSLGSFTENRNALLITDDGGVLVPTPRSKPSDNIFGAYTRIDLKEDGSAGANTVFSATGEYKDDINHLFEEKTAGQKDYMVNRWGFKQPDAINLKKQAGATDLKLNIDMDMDKVPDLITGSKMFLPLRVYNLWGTRLPKAEERRQDFYFSCPFEKTDTTAFKLPAGYTIDALPETKNIQCKYASYSSRYWWDEKSGQVYTTAKIVLTNYRIPAPDYPAVKAFFDDVLRDNAQRIIIKK